jgi:hypothetical protein
MMRAKEHSGRMRLVMAISALTMVSASACRSGDDDSLVAPGKTYSYLVQLDHRPTTADSMAAVHLGVASVRSVPVAFALIVVAANEVPRFGELSGYQYFFLLVDTTHYGPATVTFASHPSPAEIALLHAISYSTYTIGFNADSTTALVTAVYTAFSTLNGDGNVTSVAIDPIHYHPFGTGMQ